MASVVEAFREATDYVVERKEWNAVAEGRATNSSGVAGRKSLHRTSSMKGSLRFGSLGRRWAAWTSRLTLKPGAEDAPTALADAIVQLCGDREKAEHFLRGALRSLGVEDSTVVADDGGAAAKPNIAAMMV